MHAALGDYLVQAETQRKLLSLQLQEGTEASLQHSLQGSHWETVPGPCLCLSVPGKGKPPFNVRDHAGSYILQSPFYRDWVIPDKAGGQGS